MVQSFTGGEVGINVNPDTTGFRAKLNAFLRSLEDEVHVNVVADTGALRRETEAATRDRTMKVNVEGDWTALDQLRRQDERLRRQMERPIKVAADPTPAVEGIRKAIRQAKDMTESTDLDMSKPTVDGLTELGKQITVYHARIRDLERQQDKLTKKERERAAKVKKDIADQKALLTEHSMDYAHRTEEIDKLKKALESLPRNDSYAKRLREDVKAVEVLRKQAKSDRDDAQKELDRINAASEQATAVYEDSMRRLKAASDEALDAIATNATKTRGLWRQLNDEAAKTTRFDLAHGAIDSDIIPQLDGTIDRLAEIRAEQDKTRKAEEQAAKATTKVNYAHWQTARTLDTQTRPAFTEQRRIAAELTRTYDEQETELKALAGALQKANPFGVDKKTAAGLNAAIKQVRYLRDYAAKHPIQAKLKMETGDWDKAYATVWAQARELSDELEKRHDLEVRVRFWEDNAEKVEDRIRRLTHERVDVPVSFRVEQERLAADMRRVADQIKADPDRRAELEADLQIRVEQADRQIREWERRHDQFKMDVDLETALASAHLAYLTRPRTVDILANVKSTNAGRIITGMTSGATGLKGVQNQFDKLAASFGRFDEIIPRLGALGTIAAGVGAGLTNLASSALGVGASIASMSKAALAAPAALTGLAAAGYAGYQVFQDAKEKISDTGTALSGLNHEMGEAAWDEYGARLLDTINSIAPTVRDGMTGIAREEGKVVAGLAGIVERSDDMRQLPRMFDNTRNAVADLNPGLQSATAAFLQLGDATSKYLPEAATYLSDMARGWATWVDTASRTGAIDESMARVIEQGGYLKSSIQSLAGILKGAYSGLAEYQNGLQGISESLAAADRAINSTKAQDTLRAWAEGAKQAQLNFRASFTGVGDDMYRLRDVIASTFADAGTIMGSALSNITRALADAGPGLRDFSAGVRDGFTVMADALGDSGPMLSSLAGMAGQLSRTFGGTLANALRAAAPLITTIANGANLMAKAFDALPGPLQGAIALYMTFGRAAKSAVDGLKTGMLQNIQQTLQYRQVMQQVGVSSKGASVGVRELASALMRLNMGSTAGVLSGTAAAIDGIGDAADRSRTRIEGVAVGAGNAARETSRIGDAAKPAASKLGKVAAAADLALGAFGGLAGLGVTAVFTGIGIAMDDYSTRAANAKKAADELASSMTGLKQPGEDTTSAIDKVKQSLNDSSIGHGDALGWLSGAVSGMQSAQQSASRLGISQDELTKAVTGSKDEYDKLQSKLGGFTTQIDPVTGQLSVQGKASADLSRQLEQLRDTYGEAGSNLSRYVSSQQHAADMQSQLSDSLTRFNESFANNGGTLDKATAGGRRNIEMLDGIATSARNAALQSLAYGQATGDMGTATQDAVNIIGDARNSIISTMTATGMSADEAARYADSLGLIPGDVGTKITVTTTMSRDEIAAYVNQLKLTPEQVRTVMALDDQGAITDITSLQNVISMVVNGDYTMVMTADGKQVYLTADQVKEYARRNADGTYTTTLDAKDLASDKIGSLETHLKALGTFSQNDISIIMSGDADAISRIQNLSGKLKGILSQKDIDLIIRTQDNSSPALDGIREKLRQIGMTPTQIDVLLRAIDQLSGPADEANQHVQGISDKTVRITAETAQALNGLDTVNKVPMDDKTVHAFADTLNALSGLATVNGTPLDPKTAQLFADTANALAGVDMVNGSQLDPKTALLLADTAQALMGIGQVNGTPLDSKTTTLLANTLAAFAGINSVNGATLADKWTTLRARDEASQTIARVQNLRIADKTFTVTAYYTSAGEKVYGGTIPKNAATGGRILGPGTGTSDSIPAWLSNGEMVIRAASVRRLDRKYGRSFLNMLNALGDMPDASKPSPAALRARSHSMRLAAGGRVNANMAMPTIEVKPNIMVSGGESKAGDTYVTQNFEAKVFRSDEDLYPATSIYFSNAARAARILGVNHGK